MGFIGWDNIGGNEYKPPGWLDPTNWPIGSKSIASFLMNMFGMSIQTLNKVSLASMPITNNIQDFMVLAMGRDGRKVGWCANSTILARYDL